MENTASTATVLEPIVRLVIPERTGKFYPSEHFASGRQIGNLTIGMISKPFLDWFLAGNGRVEGPVGEHELIVSRILRPASDKEIAEACGGCARAEVTLSDLRSVLEYYPDQLVRRSGPDNREQNIFFVRGFGEALNVSHVLLADNSCRFFANGYGEGHKLWEPGSIVFTQDFVG